jgi:hypothetical protein
MLQRREALIRIGAGAAGLLCWPGARPGAARAAVDDLEALAERLRVAPGPAAFDVAADAIRAGADHKTLLGAIFLCGVREIRPRPHGILHSVMVVESTFQLAEPSSPQEAWLAVLWNLDDLKRSQELDRSEAGDWKLPARPQPRRVAREEARRELVAAMEAWDAERADRAIVELLPHVGHAELFELLWPLVARCYAFIGHKLIYAAQVERVLERIGWIYAEPALRSLAMTVLVSRDTAAFDRSRELTRRLPEGWQGGREVPEQSAELLGALRAASPEAAQERVVDAFRSGLAPQTVWDALRLLGSEVFLHRRGRSAAAGRSALLPVHALTVTNAFGRAWRATRLDATRRLLVLQAAGWLPAMRDDLARLADLSMQGPGIEALGTGVEAPPPELGAILEHASPGQARVYLDAQPGRTDAYLAGLRSALFRTAQEHHQQKYAAAMQEESRLVHARWASRILAPAIDYVANPRDPETEVYRRSLHALHRAGVAASPRAL